jgi:hypothetical protein
MKPEKPTYIKILREITQDHSGRKEIYEKIESILEKPLICYFTSFSRPVLINNKDAEMIKDILEKMGNLKNGVSMMISSPGGDGVAAERIVNIMRSYSGTGKYQVIVPGRAKSAATIICLGSEEIIMSNTSELGTIDPQVLIEEESQSYPAYILINAFNELFEEAIETNGNLEPYIQQLSRFDYFDIKQFETWMELSESIAVKLLKSGMMKGLNEDDIKNKIKMFLVPKQTKTHSRPIYAPECKKCDLNIRIINRENENELWNYLYELYARVYHLTNRMPPVKIIESKDISMFSEQNRINKK